MNIFYDENMPFAAEFFADFGELHPFAGRELNASQVKDADVLLVRSITKVNEALLSENSRLQFVGTATIGVDHIDQCYLQQRGIPFVSAPGCNAISVAEYVISALVLLAERQQKSLFDYRVGIVGAGNTGSRLSEKLQALGIAHVLCDPPLQQAGEDKRSFDSLSEVLHCDVIALHVPLTRDGEHPTYHLFGQQQLNQLGAQQILINVCRGEVVDNQALLSLKTSGKGPRLVWDVWENEPDILQPLIPLTDIATAHIAGYSLEGKSRGTEMLYQALCQQLERPVTLKLADHLPVSDIAQVVAGQQDKNALVSQLVRLVYDVRRDDEIFRRNIEKFGFDHIRKTYPARREFSSVTVVPAVNTEFSWPYELGFKQQ